MSSRRSSYPIYIALVIALIGGLRYSCQRQKNPITGEMQHVAMSPGQEIALGLHSAREMIAQHGGEVRDRVLEPYVESVGQKLVRRSPKGGAPYRFDFHVLADSRTINAFALPGGQVFITTALLGRMRSEAQLAAVLGHEIGHVIARHGAQHLAKQQLGSMLVTAVGIGTYDPDRRYSGQAAAVLAQATNQLLNLRYGREDELESDRYGLELLRDSGYDPRAIIELMRILEEAGGGGRQVEFLSTHPNPGNRIGRLREQIEALYPGGIPSSLTVGESEYQRSVLGYLEPGLSGPRPGVRGRLPGREAPSRPTDSDDRPSPSPSTTHRPMDPVERL